MQAADRKPTTAVRADPVLVRINGAVKHFPIGGFGGLAVRAVDGVDLEIRRGETLGLVGESGCGKSTLARLVTALLPVTAGSIMFDGQDITRLRGSKLRRVRRRMQIIFQDPFASLDPRMTVGDILQEPLDNFSIGTVRERRVRVQELLRLVGLNPNFTNRYPHEFSGGQRQRIGIARALAVNPSFIVCDEAVSALDVSIAAQIINLLQDLQREFNLTYLFIAHDLAVVRHLSDRIAVMYLGKVVETADRNDIYDRPQHPYTKALLSSIPVPDPAVERERAPISLKGEIPSPVNPPSGCRFHPRCPIARAPGICSDVDPPLEPHGAEDQAAACHFAGQF
ncbi:MAG: ABC transporter ATP-binding protein [Chloroflexi bacterium]|nr:MAG: ABC transporter ATP-binding protein [Chloroflexota bacterium]TME41879.1 MAG: ABC transporter ATP-binding protein [Chloroflexota bacterium]TME52315.1 MAG: ABC transporter ATP-binding protein [Chloroflexota bacterium]